MLKYALLAGALTLSGTALAQTTPAPTAAPATTPQSTTTTAPSAPATAQPAPTTAAPAAPTTAQVAPAPAAVPDASNQVASIVDTEFAAYDKDGNGSLSKAEFATWMGKLKAASPAAAAPADATADAKWNDAAFAQADADKSKALSKEELTGFLSQSAKTAA